MNISGGVSLSAIASNVGVTGSNGVTTRDQMAVAVMRKAMDMQQQTAATIINSMPQPASALPSNVGRNINVTA